jgi:hypothetical protein
MRTNQSEPGLRILDSISASAKTDDLNEDAVGHTSRAAWVIDGATEVSDRPSLVSGMSNATLLARTLSSEIESALLHQPFDFQLAIATVADEVTKKIEPYVTKLDVPASEQPTATFAMIVLESDTLHFVGIGDCRVVYQCRDGRTALFGSSDELEVIENQILEERQKILRKYPAEDPWPRLKPFIRSLRENVNMQGGYSAVHPTRPWLRRLQHKVMPAMRVDKVLLATDGFYRLTNVFGLFPPGTLLEAAASKGLAGLLSQLRSVENKDDKLVRFPRIKSVDDASAILAALSQTI